MFTEDYSQRKAGTEELLVFRRKQPRTYSPSPYFSFSACLAAKGSPDECSDFAVESLILVLKDDDDELSVD